MLDGRGDKNFEKVRIKAEEIYKSIGKVFCPFLKDSVSFNAKGLEHLKFKSKRKTRDRADAYIRLKNIHMAPKILQTSHTLQELKKANVMVEVKTNTREEVIMKPVIYYGFVAIIQDGDMKKRMKVVVKEIQDGEKHFWSIIPAWRNNKELRLFTGDPEED